MSAIESAGSFTMPPLTGTLDGLWDVILDLQPQSQGRRTHVHSFKCPGWCTRLCSNHRFTN